MSDSSMKEWFSEKNFPKNFRNFLINIVIVFLIFVVIQFFSSPLIDDIEIPKQFFTVEYTVLGGTSIFTLIIFIMLTKDMLKKYPKREFSIPLFLLFFVLGAGLNALFFYSKYLISLNPERALDFFIPILLLRYFFLIGSVVSFFVSIFTISYIKKFLKMFKKELMIASIFFICFAIFSLLVQSSWQFLSFSITRILEFILVNTLDGVRVYSNETLGIGSFIVNIGKVCSGIESILLFTTLYLFIFFLDRKKINKKRMILVFIPGLLGIYLVNVLRIYILLLVGHFWSKELAVGIFHTNAGWILFIVYFFLFWKICYNWVIKK